MMILVTGGSGFIGSHLVDKLIEHGHDVRVMDLKKPHRSNIEWYRGDILNPRDCLTACRDIDVVYHLAAIADVNVALSDPELCIKVNELGTLNMLKAAVATEVDRFILASTSWVYGHAKGVVTEETPLPPPNNVYTKTKIGQEHLVITWNKHYGLPYTILRYGIPYGPRMRSNMAIAIFVRKAMRGEPIKIFGNGNQGRCFIYVEDLAEGNVAALHPSAKNEVINLAGKEFVTVNAIVEVLREIFGNKVRAEHAPPRPGDFRGVIISIEKAKRLLGWEPKTNFRTGLVKYIEWIKSPTR